MRKLFQVFICLALAATSLGAQTSDKKAAAAGLPPLIDRELIFGNPEIVNAELSPDGKYLAFQKPWHDTRNIYVKGVDEPFTAARLLTTETKRPVPGYFWTRNSKYILYVKDNDGDENFNIYAVDPAAKPAASAEAPPSRDLTGLKGVRVVIYDVPKSDPDLVYIGLNDRDKAWHDLYKLNCPRVKRRYCARTRSVSRRGLLTCGATCAWPAVPPKMATRKFFAWMPTNSPRFTPAMYLNSATSSVSRKMANAPTW
jgi:hypothetical protein